MQTSDLGGRSLVARPPRLSITPSHLRVPRHVHHPLRLYGNWKVFLVFTHRNPLLLRELPALCAVQGCCPHPPPQTLVLPRQPVYSPRVTSTDTGTAL